MSLVLRLYMHCTDDAEAAVLAARLERILAPWSPGAVRPPARYWRLTATFDFAYRLSPATDAGFSDFTTRSAAGWERLESPGEARAAWSPNAGDVLLMPEVRRAELQLFDRTDLAWHARPAPKA